jgi:hypothetical protein
MKGRKREHSLIEGHITRYINMPRFDFKTLKTFVKIVVAKEDTLSGTEGKFLCVVGAKVRPAGAPKGPKMGVVGFGMEEALKRGILIDNTARKSINQINSSDKGFVPKFERHTGMG